MFKYLLKKILIMVAIFIAVMLVTFTIFYFLIGSNPREFSTYGNDGFDACLGALSLHDTFPGKFIRYMYDIFAYGRFNVGDAGYELAETLTYRFKFTLLLTGLGFFFSLLVGIPAGLYAGTKRGSVRDGVLSTVTLIFASIPSYVLAIAITLLFCLALSWLPPFGIKGPEYFILPTIVASAGGIATVTRMTRSAAVQVMEKPYIRTLYAKGISNGKIIWKHVLKNSLGVLLPSINSLFAQILCSTLIAERFYSIPGIAMTSIDAVSDRRAHVALGCVFCFAVIIIVVGFIVDVVNVIINPKLRTENK